MHDGGDAAECVCVCRGLSVSERAARTRSRIMGSRLIECCTFARVQRARARNVRAGAMRARRERELIINASTDYARTEVVVECVSVCAQVCVCRGVS